MARKHLWALLCLLGIVACNQVATNPVNPTSFHAPRSFRQADVRIDPVTALYHLKASGGFDTPDGKGSIPVDTMIEQPYWFSTWLPFSTIDSSTTGVHASGSTNFSGQSPTFFDLSLRWSRVSGRIDSLVISHTTVVSNSSGPCLGCPYGSDRIVTEIRLQNVAITDSTVTSISFRIPLSSLTSNPKWLQSGEYLEDVQPQKGLDLTRNTVLSSITQFNDTSKLVIRLTR